MPDPAHSRRSAGTIGARSVSAVAADAAVSATTTTPTSSSDRYSHGTLPSPRNSCGRIDSSFTTRRCRPIATAISAAR